MKKLYESPKAMLTLIDDTDVLTASMTFSANASDDVNAKDVHSFSAFW